MEPFYPIRAADWLEREVPGQKEKVLNRIRLAQGGCLNSSVPLDRLRGTGEQAAQLRQIFDATCRRVGLDTGPPDVTTCHFRKLTPGQGELFD